MKKTVVVCAMMMMAVGAFGQSAKFGFQLTGANINVSGALSDVYGFGYGGGVHLDINLPVLLSFRLQGDYVRVSPDEGKYQKLVSSVIPGSNPTDYKIEGGAINVWSAHANVKSSFLPLPIVSPYITGGIGLANLSSSELTVKYQGQPLGNAPGVKGETNFSANVGAGADLKLGLELFIEVRYTWIFTSGETSTYIPISVGVTL
ncbi:MAG: outer membrane beta-barrel protein [Ignavibacteriae bacterium]|nr:outer membrane beta-barrel protein [Ignavibacteriota bacterium]